LAQITGGRYFGVPEGSIPHKGEPLSRAFYRLYLRNESRRIATVFEEFRVQAISEI